MKGAAALFLKREGSLAFYDPEGQIIQRWPAGKD
jgi:hypothetical protein